MEDSFKLLIVFFLCLPVLTVSDQTVFNVLDYGAVGNGKTDDTNAFVNAWQQTCTFSSLSSSSSSSSFSSPVMQVPPGKTFLIQPLQFNGPCNSNSVTLEIDGNLVAPRDPLNWKCHDNVCGKWIYFHRVDGLMVRGHGIIDGRGGKWWHTNGQNRVSRPTIMEISNSNKVFLGGGLRFKDSPQMHVVLNGLTSLLVSNVTIDAPGDSPNTDGIHVQICTNASIDRSRIGTGDDCISIGDGSSSVTISNIICGPGHGISIGSLGKNGAEDKVEDVRVSDVVFIGATNGARIKTWQGGRGYARDIVFERILSHDTMNPIIIDQFYCDHQTCTTSESAVQITNVTYRQIIGTSRKETAVKLKCSEAVPCRDIVVDDLHIVTREGDEPGFECSNVYGRAYGDKVPKLLCLE